MTNKKINKEVLLDELNYDCESLDKLSDEIKEFVQIIENSDITNMEEFINEIKIGDNKWGFDRYDYVCHFVNSCSLILHNLMNFQRAIEIVKDGEYDFTHKEDGDKMYTEWISNPVRVEENAIKIIENLYKEEN